MCLSVCVSYPTLHDPMDCSLPDSSVHRIFPARTLEWVSIYHSRASSRSGTEPTSPVSLALAGGFVATEPPGKPLTNTVLHPICRRLVVGCLVSLCPLRGGSAVPDARFLSIPRTPRTRRAGLWVLSTHIPCASPASGPRPAVAGLSSGGCRCTSQGPH